MLAFACVVLTGADRPRVDSTQRIAGGVHCLVGHLRDHGVVVQEGQLVAAGRLSEGGRRRELATARGIASRAAISDHNTDEVDWRAAAVVAAYNLLRQGRDVDAGVRFAFSIQNSSFLMQNPSFLIQ